MLLPVLVVLLFGSLTDITLAKKTEDVSVLHNLVDRILANKEDGDHFQFQVCRQHEDCGSDSDGDVVDGGGWFRLQQQVQPDEGRLLILGSSNSDLAYGLGYYLRYYCNMTLGWQRIGGTVRNLALPNATTSTWPVLTKPIYKKRRVQYSYLMNVCTHSYSLVWHDWESGWEPLIDWASLMGINNLLACEYFSCRIALNCIVCH
jgi:Alpha-N-acetylglucosaminidase (NAGLU) tim-barrel domain/Alpha-N-acetylglucosaminidase (NAGLU) N-terminal domain